MSNQQISIRNQVNAHGTTIQQVEVKTPESIIELSFQFVLEKWVPFKRVVKTMH